MRPPAGHFVIEHFLPGRLRVRLPREADLERLVEDWKGRAGVISASASPVTGGALVRFDPAQVEAQSLLDVLGAHSLRAVPLDPAPTPTTVAEALVTATTALDAKVKQSTRGALSLGSVLPLGLVGWAASELVRGRARPLAWTSALWYAHSIFRDYNREAPSERPAPGPPAR